jgi:hypothetical protein
MSGNLVLVWLWNPERPVFFCSGEILSIIQTLSGRPMRSIGLEKNASVFFDQVYLLRRTLASSSSLLISPHIRLVDFEEL